MKRRQLQRQIQNEHFYCKTPRPSNTQRLFSSEMHLPREVRNELAILREENEKLDNENEELRDDFQSLLNVHMMVCRKFVRVGLLTDRLQNQEVNPNGRRYESYKDKLGPGLLRSLRGLDDDQKSDATFVLQCMQKLYENKFDELMQQTACGIKGFGISTENRRLIQAMFVERLTNIYDMDETEMVFRFVRLNVMINYAIRKIQKTNVSLILE